MAEVWTAPRNWLSGEVVTAAIMNAQARDNPEYLKGVLGGSDLQHITLHANKVLVSTGTFKVARTVTISDSSITLNDFSETIASVSITVPTGRTMTILGWGIVQCTNDGTARVFSMRLDIGSQTGEAIGEGMAANATSVHVIGDEAAARAAGAQTVALKGARSATAGTVTINAVTVFAVGIVDG